MNAACKFRQKWKASVGTTFTKPRANFFAHPVLTNLQLKWVVAQLAPPRSGSPDPEEEALSVDMLDRPLAPAGRDEWGTRYLGVAAVANLEHVQRGCKMAPKKLVVQNCRKKY